MSCYVLHRLTVTGNHQRELTLVEWNAFLRYLKITTTSKHDDTAASIPQAHSHSLDDIQLVTASHTLMQQTNISASSASSSSSSSSAATASASQPIEVNKSSTHHPQSKKVSRSFDDDGVDDDDDDDDEAVEEEDQILQYQQIIPPPAKNMATSWLYSIFTFPFSFFWSKKTKRTSSPSSSSSASSSSASSSSPSSAASCIDEMDDLEQVDQWGTTYPLWSIVDHQFIAKKAAATAAAAAAATATAEHKEAAVSAHSHSLPLFLTSSGSSIFFCNQGSPITVDPSLPSEYPSPTRDFNECEYGNIPFNILSKLSAEFPSFSLWCSSVRIQLLPEPGATHVSAQRATQLTSLLRDYLAHRTNDLSALLSAVTLEWLSVNCFEQGSLGFSKNSIDAPEYFSLPSTTTTPPPAATTTATQPTSLRWDQLTLYGQLFVEMFQLKDIVIAAQSQHNFNQQQQQQQQQSTPPLGTEGTTLPQETSNV